MLILEIGFTLAGVPIILLAIKQMSILKSALKFIQEPTKSYLKKSIRNHRSLMIFFLIGYIIVGVSLLEEISDILLSLIFFMGATFIFFSVMIQRKMISEILKTIEALVPICMYCKRIQIPDSDPLLHDSWESIDQYISMRTNLKLTHGICPECAKALYPRCK